MDIVRWLEARYSIGPVHDVSILSGSQSCHLIVTERQSYVLKAAGRPDFAQIFRKVQKTLTENDLVQGRIIANRDNELISLDGYSLYEYIAGDALEKYSEKQFYAIVKYMSTYNTVLRDVSFVPEEIHQRNSWDKLRSISFMCSHAETMISGRGFEHKAQCLLRHAVQILSDHLDYFRSSDKQLIHSDLGPGKRLLRHESDPRQNNRIGDAARFEKGDHTSLSA